MKKGIIITILSIVALLVFAGLAYFFVFPKISGESLPDRQAGASSPKSNAAPVQLKSFRGALADILKNVEAEASEIKEDIAQAVTNSFSENPVPATEANSTENSFTFAILGDTQYFTAGNSGGNFQKAVASISKFNPDLVVQTGDLIRGCEGKSEDAADYANWKKILGTLAEKTYAVQGNHDRVKDESSCDKIWRDAFNFPTNGPAGLSEQVYSLDFKNSHFIFLDSQIPDGHQINDTQRAWLEQDLAKNKKEDTFVVFHEPAFPVASKIDESLDAQPSQRNSLWQIIDKYNVTAVFNGHEHIVSRRKVDSSVFPGAKNSIYQFVFGDTDSFNHDLPKPGVAEYASQGQGRSGIVKVNGKEITVEAYDDTGKLLNTFTFSK